MSERKLFMRVCDVTINGRKLSYPPLLIDFEIEFSDRAPSCGKVTIAYPSKDTVSACEKQGSTAPQIIINAGHKADNGTVFSGEIVKFIENKTTGILNLTIADKTSLWSSAMVNVSWSGMISARDAATQILSSFGVVSAEMIFDNEHVYTDGLSFSGVSLSSAMQKIAKDTQTRFTFKNGQASFLPDSQGGGTAVLLSYETGLLEATKIPNGLKVKSLFMHKIQGGGLVVVENDTGRTNLKVKKGKHVFSCTGSANCDFEGIAI